MPKEKMSNTSFRFMNLTFKIMDFIHPYIKKRVKTFDIKSGMTVVDYGCGPGRYTTEFANLVGKDGKVYGADIHDLAVNHTKEKAHNMGLNNVETVLVKGYDCPLSDEVADRVCALDMFFMIREPNKFLNELNRITKEDGLLIIDDGHQKRIKTLEKINDSGYWEIMEETNDHLKCKPIK
ncbi:class I SAM-dependent methyltransferase [Methanobacterium alcaliphilum]|uniref:class I SAM-dependent methyltransferase n=1 Tax=Methanobacterium alcaliphilum TaxID=392018 RepID=UPI002009F069|nr:methyltransferase domain-containing protein [Methanobacterium alcaliphilum]MCK9151055.1 methyltransferase domain-containing protein [Methanobacterium alcaliphilum]